MFNVGDLVVANCDAAGNGDLSIEKDHLYQVRKIWAAGGHEYLTVSLPDGAVTCEFYSWRFSHSDLSRPGKISPPKKKLAKIYRECDTRGQFKNSSMSPIAVQQTLADVLDLLIWAAEITTTKSPRHIQAVRCKEMIFKLQQQGASHAQARQAEAETRPGEAPEAREALLGPRLVTVNHDNYGRARPELLLSSFCDND